MNRFKLPLTSAQIAAIKSGDSMTLPVGAGVQDMRGARYYLRRKTSIKVVSRNGDLGRIYCETNGGNKLWVYEGTLV